jgi:SAM-dependent methyltransferase
VRAALEKLLEQVGVRRLLDAGCGDFNWFRYVELRDCAYTGVDVVPELISHLTELYATAHRRFLLADITRDRLPRCDLVLCREVLMHFPDADLRAAVRNLRRTGARWLLTTTFAGRGRNEPIELGSWRPLDLEAEPFRFPPPLHLIEDVPDLDGEFRDKRLGLWPFSTL